ncbi:methyl-accepting chemotaxis sensory transducer with GAF sensor [Gloeocapsa sp. PCC 7428]|uniref:methyl-accepting chemotaxis protein n=1 Tax=Gloeocapsa sp. PCC 7428 TaxID=1173026 RepID=UPI0002A5F3DA|nr:methyl-accepting chemotaxis protein [Gloeocapsa sp. PCC 7428]AFZ28878.1 methyl-accepting chemotaxis sensory transducer with GAF sensor [Gloeocapsa sp. PCC 7428]
MATRFKQESTSRHQHKTANHLDNDRHSINDIPNRVQPQSGLDVNHSSIQPLRKLGLPFWQRLSLKTKATTLAIALSTLPIVIIGATAYYITNKGITNNVTQQQQARAIALAGQFDNFIAQRYLDIQNLAQSSMLSDPAVRAIVPTQAKQFNLEQYIKNNPGYDNIVVIDPAGQVILQTAGEGIANYSNVDYFQQSIRTKRPVVTPPRKSLLTGEYSIYAAAPVIDTTTGEVFAVVRSRTPVQYFNEILHAEAKTLARTGNSFGVEEYFAINDLGKIVVAPTEHLDYIGEDAQAVFPRVAPRLANNTSVGSIIDRDRIERQQYLVSYTPIRQIESQTDLNWSAMVALPTAQVFAARQGLFLPFFLGTSAIVLLIGAIAAYLVNRALRPVVNASLAVQQLGNGHLNTRLSVHGKDELAMLGANINNMADQLQGLLQQQEEVTEQAQLFADVTFRIRRSLNVDDILKTAVKEVRKVLRCDRVVIYRFNPDYSGTVVAESVAPGWTQALAEIIDDPCFKDRHIQQYKNGRVRAIDNIHQAGLTDCHIKTLERFEVKANLVAPILKDNQLLGLLIAHHCATTRAWQQAEIDLFTQLATQIGFALDQAYLLEQVEKARAVAEEISREQRQQKEALQQQLLGLLSDVEEATKGNLTVRAEVTAGEIGTVADFFNSIIESLRQLATDVKTAATQVNVAVAENQGAMHQLADQALQQAEAIAHSLDSLAQMTDSIQDVAASAHQAAEITRTASLTAQVGGVAMNHTVDSILNLRQTVAETAGKVRQLSESSQQISKVVSLINQIALQTNVLAINASIEANRAGEEGRGFALVAEEIGELASQSSAATKEIEQIVENIQRETVEVAHAMELGTNQVVEGTNLVEDTKKNLKKIFDVSRQIDQLVQSISHATIAQAQTSQQVTQLMKEIATVSEQTANSAQQVSGSLQQTTTIAQQLQASVGAFKVDDES